MTKLLIGGSGIANVEYANKKLDSVTGVEFVKEIGLQAMELAFVHGVFMKPMLAARVKDAAQKNKIALTVHAPYYINLNPKTKQGEHYSKNVLLEAAKIGALAGATDIAFHPGSYLKMDPKEVFKIIAKNLTEIADELTMHKISVTLRPEIGGKLGAFGTLEEIVALSKLRDNIKPCIDFAHLIARQKGAGNSYENFVDVLSYIKKELGKEALDHLHIQFAGIEFTDKGEKNHLNFADCDFDYNALARALQTMDVGGVAICESPAKEHDALLFKEAYDKARA